MLWRLITFIESQKSSVRLAGVRAVYSGIRHCSAERLTSSELADLMEACPSWRMLTWASACMRLVPSRLCQLCR